MPIKALTNPQTIAEAWASYSAQLQALQKTPLSPVFLNKLEAVFISGANACFSLLTTLGNIEDEEADVIAVENLNLELVALSSKFDGGNHAEQH